MVEARRAALVEIVEAQAPMTVRQVFYRATVEGLDDKTEQGYAAVQDDLAKLRRRGDVPYCNIADNTRFQRRPKTYASVEEALKNTAKFYRKSLWAEADAYVEVWLEKDALSGVIWPVTSEYDVPLMVARGYASLSFLHGAADAISNLDVPAYIYHVGDYDPSGVNPGEKIEIPRAPRRNSVSDSRPQPPHAPDQEDRQPTQGIRRDLGRAGRDRARDASRSGARGHRAASPPGPIRNPKDRGAERTRDYVPAGRRACAMTANPEPARLAVFDGQRCLGHLYGALTLGVKGAAQ
jgi:hypothetical protein